MVRVFVVTQHLVGCKLRKLRTPRGLSVSSPTISRDHRMNPEAPALLLSSLQFRFVSMERIAFSSLSRCRSLSLSCSFPSRSIGACKDCTVAVLVNSIIPSCGGRSRICRYRNYRGFFVLPCRGKPTCTETAALMSRWCLSCSAGSRNDLAHRLAGTQQRLASFQCDL